MTMRAVACFLGIAIAAVYAGASIGRQTRSIIKAHRSTSDGDFEPGTIRDRSVVDGCLRFIGPSDVVAILYSDANPAQDVSPVFILYRLSYRAYPTRFEAAAIGDESIPTALAHLPRKPNWVLLLGPQTNVPGYEETARFSPNDRLLRATGERSVGEQK